MISGLDWSSFLSALIGGGFAIAGVFLAASREREQRQIEERSKFQRDTLIVLQDSIERHVRATQQIEFWRKRPERMERSRREALGEYFNTPQGDALWPAPTALERHQHYEDLFPHTKEWHESRYIIERLVSRVDNDHVRTDVAALVDAARNAIEVSVMQNVDAINRRLNDAIGVLIRSGEATDDGFIVPDRTKKRRLFR